MSAHIENTFQQMRDIWLPLHVHKHIQASPYDPTILFIIFFFSFGLINISMLWVLAFEWQKVHTFTHRVDNVHNKRTLDWL